MDGLQKKFETVMNNNNHKKILYIGTTEGKKGLYSRIAEQYMRLKYNHSGGRIIWQIDGVENFYIAWIPTKNAKQIETALIQSYAYLIKKNEGTKDTTRKISDIYYYPFANRKK